MIEEQPGLLAQIRDKFAHVDSCPFTGPRVFFENAGGALTLKSTVETSAKFAAIPDNQGRDNPASHALMAIIKKAKDQSHVLFNAPDGQFFVGESGTELLFRMVRTAVMAAPEGGVVLGSSVEHPASRSAAQHWAKATNRPYISVPHNRETGAVEAADYAAHVTLDTRVATILHTSPCDRNGNECCGYFSSNTRRGALIAFIIVDGIQHAAHGALNLASYQVDGYAISPYKMFSRHGFGYGWISDRLSKLDHETLLNGPAENWELGTRDTGAYATISDIVDYLDWLGCQFSDSGDLRVRLEAASRAIEHHEKALTDAILYGSDNLPGIRDIDGIEVIGGYENPRREGLVALRVTAQASSDVVAALNSRRYSHPYAQSRSLFGQYLIPDGVVRLHPHIAVPL
jgi:selenocysteine lyase/cysteine desulfurase